MGSFLVQLLIMGILGIVAAAIAESKGRNAVGWFFAGFFFHLIGILIVAVLPNLKKEQAERLRAARENRRLREQLRQERIKSEAFRRHTTTRLDVHDQALGVDTRSPQALAEGQPAPAQLAEGSAPGYPPEPPSARTWYYESDGATMGPVSEAEIRALIRAGRVTRSTLLWREDLGEWTPLSRIHTFRSDLRP